MGLNESYTSVRDNIMMMHPPSNIDRAYYLLLQEERQRGIQSMGQYSSESSSFAIPTQRSNQTQGRTTNFTMNTDGYNFINNQENRRNINCNYCKNNDTQLTNAITFMVIHKILSQILNKEDFKILFKGMLSQQMKVMGKFRQMIQKQ